MADSHVDPFGANDDDLEPEMLRYIKIRTQISIEPADYFVEWWVRRIEGPPAVMTAQMSGRRGYDELADVIEDVGEVSKMLLNRWIPPYRKTVSGEPF